MMIKQFEGKKLLILGATVDEIQIINAAKEMGLYTIATDYNTDWTDSPAKFAADKAWNISWSDIDALEKKAIETEIDGVMAGYSEKRILAAIALCKRLNKPFYVEDEKVLLKTFDKQKFKNLCKHYGVPVTRDYYDAEKGFEDWSKDVIYPAVIKPADNGGSRGITTCFNKNELKQGIDYALSFSDSGSVVVEELIKDAREVIAYYTFSNGKAVLSAMCDKYERNVSDGFNSLPDTYLYPSSHIQEYVYSHDENVKNALLDMGMREGSANLQGFYREDFGFKFFEMDFRVGGTNTYLFTDYYSNENYLKMLIEYSMSGATDVTLLKNADPFLKGKYGCIFTLLSKNGTITSQEGKGIVDAWDNILYTCFYHKIGTVIEVNGSQFPKTFRAYIVGDTIEEIKDTIIKIQNTVKVKDEFGNNMLFENFDVNQLNDNNAC